MAHIGGPQSSTENMIKMAASTSTSAASSRGIYWPARVVTLIQVIKELPDVDLGSLKGMPTTIIPVSYTHLTLPTKLEV